MKVYFVADYFIDDIVGGAEKNDAALMLEMEKSNLEVERIRCRELSPQFIENNPHNVLWVLNFVSFF